MHPHGFTLIERMIVVLGILAAIAIRAKVAEGLTLVAPIKVAVDEPFLTKGAIPAGGNRRFYLPAPAGIRGHYTRAVTVTGGLIPLGYRTPGGGATGAPRILAPTTATGGVHWTCGTPGSTLPNRYRPANCRN